MVFQRSLVLLGRAGYGTSSSGNTILGEKLFYASHDSISVTDDIESHCRNNINVVDTPPFLETSAKLSLSDINNVVKKCLVICTSGIDCFLLVLRYGQRLTATDLKFAFDLKKALGENFLSRHCVVLFTHGDEFERRIKQDVTFDQWVTNQTGSLAELLRECQYRYFLINNLEPEKNNIRGLMEIAEKCSLYTADDFFRRKLQSCKDLVQTLGEDFTQKSQDELKLDVERIRGNIRDVFAEIGDNLERHGPIVTELNGELNKLDEMKNAIYSNWFSFNKGLRVLRITKFYRLLYTERSIVQRMFIFGTSFYILFFFNEKFRFFNPTNDPSLHI